MFHHLICQTSMINFKYVLVHGNWKIWTDSQRFLHPDHKINFYIIDGETNRLIQDFNNHVNNINDAIQSKQR